MGQCYLVGAGGISPAGGVLYGDLTFKGNNSNSMGQFKFSTEWDNRVLNLSFKGRNLNYWDMLTYLPWDSDKKSDRPRAQFGLRRWDNNNGFLNDGMWYNLIEFSGSDDNHYDRKLHIFAMYGRLLTIGANAINSDVTPQLSLEVKEFNDEGFPKNVSYPTSATIINKCAGWVNKNEYVDFGTLIKDISDGKANYANDEYLELRLSDKVALDSGLYNCLCLNKISYLNQDIGGSYPILHTANFHDYLNKLGTLTSTSYIQVQDNGKTDISNFYGLAKTRNIKSVDQNNKEITIPHIATLGVGANGATVLEHKTNGVLDSRLELRPLITCNPEEQDIDKQHNIEQWYGGNADALCIRTNTSGHAFNIYGAHNKPMGRYMGTGKADREIIIGGPSTIGILLITDGSSVCIVRANGCHAISTGDYWVKLYSTTFQNGVLKLASSSNKDYINKVGETYYYQVL